MDTKGHFSCTSRMDFRASAVQSATIQPQSSVLKGKAPCGTRACDGRWAPARAAAPNHTCVAGPAFQHDDPHRLPSPTATLGPPAGQAREEGKAPSRPEDVGTATSALTALPTATCPVTARLTHVAVGRWDVCAQRGDEPARSAARAPLH